MSCGDRISKYKAANMSEFIALNTVLLNSCKVSLFKVSLSLNKRFFNKYQKLSLQLYL